MTYQHERDELPKDYGCDPLPDGMFRMVPSGDIVDAAERKRRLGEPVQKRTDCLGMSWEEIAQKQGGLHTLDTTRKKYGLDRRGKK